MNLKAVLYRRWLRDVTYHRPGYRLNWHDDQGLEISVDTFDSANIPEIVEQTHAFGYPPDNITRGEFYTWVMQNLMLQAFHEIAEFFLVNGARVYNPHDESGLAFLGDTFGDIRIADLTRKR